MILAIYIRVAGTSGYYYNQDEMTDIFIAKGTSLQEVLRFALNEVHPPLGQIMRHYWLMISDQIWFARSLALLFGIALIPLYYVIGKKINNQLTGIFSASLIAFGLGFIVQSYLVRNYTIFLFFLSFSFYFYLLWRDNKTIRNLLIYTLFAILAGLTHFSAIFAIFSIAAYETIYLYKKAPNKKF